MKYLRVFLTLGFMLFLLVQQVQANDVVEFKCASCKVKVQCEWLETISKAEISEQANIFYNTLISIKYSETILSNGFEFAEYFIGSTEGIVLVAVAAERGWFKTCVAGVRDNCAVLVERIPVFNHSLKSLMLVLGHKSKEVEFSKIVEA